MTADGTLVACMRGVGRSYERGAERVVALDSIDLEVKQGELLSITGPSGSGKSTLLHLLGGLDRPTRGAVLLAPQQGLAKRAHNGLVDLAELDDDELARLRRQEVGFVFQSFHLLPTLTAAENVALPLILDGQGEPRARERAVPLLVQMGLSERLDHLPEELSGGERQRVALARALAPSPALLLADEPTGNLDSVQGRQILELLRREVNEEQRTVVLVTHDTSSRYLMDRVLRLQDGQLQEDGTSP